MCSWGKVLIKRCKKQETQQSLLMSLEQKQGMVSKSKELCMSTALHTTTGVDKPPDWPDLWTQPYNYPMKKVKVLIPQSCLTFTSQWILACQASLSLGFPRQEYWSGQPFPSPGDLPDPRTESRFPEWLVNSLMFQPPGKPLLILYKEQSLHQGVSQQGDLLLVLTLLPATARAPIMPDFIVSPLLNWGRPITMVGIKVVRKLA